MHSPSETWLIVEPVFAGHRFTYLLEIVRGALVRGCQVVVAIGSDAQGDLIAERLGCVFAAESVPLIRVRLPDDRAHIRGPLGLVQRAIGCWRFMSRAYREATKHCRVDFVFVPYLDDALFAVSVLGSPFLDAPFAGVTMRQRFHFREMGVVAKTAADMGMKKWLFLRMLRLKKLQRVYVIDDTLLAYFEHNRSSLAGKLRFIPDPIVPVVVTPRAKAREMLGLAGGALIVLAYGYMDTRKGIAMLLDWAARQELVPAVHVLLAGIMSPDVERQLTSEAACSLRARDRLRVINRYVERDEEQLLFSATDVVWLGYEAVELMSGVLVTAAHFRKAILFSDYGLIGRYARRHGSLRRSASSAPIDLSSLPKGIEARFFDDMSGDAQSLPDHSWENACRAIFDA